VTHASESITYYLHGETGFVYLNTSSVLRNQWDCRSRHWWCV